MANFPNIMQPWHSPSIEFLVEKHDNGYYSILATTIDGYIHTTQFYGTPRDIAKKLFQECIKPITHDGYGQAYQNSDTYPFDVRIDGAATCQFVARSFAKDDKANTYDLCVAIAKELDKLKVLMLFS